jgi:Uma2 family endonuclease
MSIAEIEYEPEAEAAWPRPWVWTREQYYRLAELGVFDLPFGRRRVELLDGEIWEQHHEDRANPEPRLFPFTRDQFYTIWADGIFGDRRVELVGGVIYLMSPIHEPHVAGVSLVTDALKAAFGSGYYVRVQAPLDIGLLTNPEPDLSVVLGSPRAYKTAPTSATLVVEVSDSTLAYDTTTKAEQYAAAGVTEYWVLDLVNGRLLVLRDPAPVAAGGHAYRKQLTLGPTDSVAPLAGPSASINVADLLP